MYLHLPTLAPPCMIPPRLFLYIAEFFAWLNKFTFWNLQPNSKHSWTVLSPKILLKLTNGKNDNDNILPSIQDKISLKQTIVTQLDTAGNTERTQRIRWHTIRRAHEKCIQDQSSTQIQPLHLLSPCLLYTICSRQFRNSISLTTTRICYLLKSWHN